MIIDNSNIPIAIFNGGHGPKNILFFLRNIGDKYSLDSNYGRMYYRLHQTGLQSNVRAIIWSQGEEDGSIGTSENNYMSRFNSLHAAWLEDYPNLEQTFIFQTNNGCAVNLNSIMVIKEAQRKIAESDDLIDIIPTSSLMKSSDDCHFTFQNGYSVFGDRLYNLISSKLYGNNLLGEIDAPNIIDAYLSDSSTLIIETDANELLLNNCDPNNFLLDDANGAIIEDIEVNGANIKLSLSNEPGDSPKLSFIGPVDGISKNYVTNLNGLEIISFHQYSINTSIYTMWDGFSWSNGLPSASKYVTIKNNYQGSTGSIEALDLTIATGADLNFDTGSYNSVIIHGDLTIKGSFVLGDEESLVMYDDGASIFGNILKKERSTNRISPYDITYWSSSVKNETIENVFLNVTKNRIFYFDQDQSSASNDSDDPNYWTIWQLASNQMIAGQGYAAEGPTGATGIQDINFYGEPNNGDISYLLKGHFDDDDEDGDKDNNFNLVGNPYPSAINITDFFDENKDVIDETIYLWTHSTPISEVDKGDFVSSDYATYNRSGGTASSTGGLIPSDTLGSGQGFFLRATSPGFLTFKNSMRRADQNTVFFRPGGHIKKNSIHQKNRIWLDLKTEFGGFNQILLSFNDESTTGYDTGYDAFKIANSNPISFYSIQKEHKFTIQSLPKLDFHKPISLGFTTNVSPRVFSIGINKIEGGLRYAPTILQDHELQILHDLKDSDYVFNVIEEGENMNRFTIHFNSDILNTNLKQEIDLKLNVNQEFLILEASHSIKRVKIHDILGTLISDEFCNDYSERIKLNKNMKGRVLLISTYFENGQVLTKKIFY